MATMSLKESQALNELLYWVRENNLEKCKQTVKREKINLQSAKVADLDGRTPLHVAAFHDCERVAEWLIREGVDVNALDSFYRTPLYLASEREHVEIQKMLIATGGMIQDPSLIALQPSAGAGGAGRSMREPHLQWIPVSANDVHFSRASEKTEQRESPGPAAAPDRTSAEMAAAAAGVPDGWGERRAPAAADSPAASAAASAHAQPPQPPQSPWNMQPTGSMRLAAIRRSLDRDIPPELRALGLEKSVRWQSHAAGPAAGGSTATTAAGAGGVARSLNSTQDVDPSQEWELDPADLSVESAPMAAGAFGEIFRGSWRGAPIVCKRLKGQFADDSTALSEMRAELAIWCRLHHPHICRFLGAVTGGGPCTLVAEFCKEGSLQALMLRHVKAGTSIKFDVALQYALDIASGMWYLHSRKPLAVMHRDLKPANCLIDGSNNIKVTDFGLSKLIVVDKALVHRGSGNNTLSGGGGSGRGGAGGGAEYLALQDKTFQMTGETGAYKYMAPEVVRHDKYSMKCDVYSFAVVVYELFEGLVATPDPQKFARDAAVRRKRPECATLRGQNLKRSRAVEGLIAACWDHDPKSRPGFEAICADLYRIKGIDPFELPDDADPSSRRRTARQSIGGSRPRPAGAAGAGAEAAEAGCACVVQ